MTFSILADMVENVGGDLVNSPNRPWFEYQGFRLSDLCQPLNSMRGSTCYKKKIIFVLKLFEMWYNHDIS